MYTITCQGITFEVRPFQKRVTCYHIAEALPQNTAEGFIEIMKNGETKIIHSTTDDDPYTTHFECHTLLENISASIWIFKEYHDSTVRYIAYSDLPKEQLEKEICRALLLCE